jgi:hypothetical protein
MLVTSTGLNSTAIGATTASTGAFTTLSASNGVTSGSGTLAAYNFSASSDGTDLKNWAWQSGSGGPGAGAIRLRALNDANSTGINAITITRTGVSSIDAINLLAPVAVTGALSATTTLQAKQSTTNPASTGALPGLSMGFDAGAEVSWIQSERNSLAEIRTLQLNPNGGPVTTGAALTVGGALSKASGSFRIEHPLPAKSATHQLVHSFIEGPQADLIYRGKVVLVDGKASVNIDAAATMTEGTFEVLCREVQCFTTNETGWTAVRGKVTGNILTIEAKDADCVDEISWMVIGERQDPHMMETDWTDDNGKVIVEPLKPSIESN